MKKIRCAIYTRKSSEEGLEQEFNSLDAQREACAAYIASQKHEGWLLLPEHYDDGGISGGTLDRESLKRLMDRVDSGLVDQIVVYKIDRLTRSLTDFAKLVERLDAAGASFVSVTQSFNTATSMGRLTLNVLLSFAQFEREVTAERIRDKISASKRKGLWMGGTVPLGYEPDGRTLRIVETEAGTVRQIYALYQSHKSVTATAKACRRAGLKSRARANNGGGRSLGRSHVHHILTNPIYAGRIRHKQNVYDGQHQPIIDPTEWMRVQGLLQTEAQKPRGSRSGRANPSYQSVLCGKLFDEAGGVLTPSHANKRGKRYRYYVSSRLVRDVKTGSDRDPKAQQCSSGWRLAGPSIETELVEAVHRQLVSTIVPRLRQSLTVAEAERLRKTIAAVADPGADVKVWCQLINRVDISAGQISIGLCVEKTAELLQLTSHSTLEAFCSWTQPFRVRKRGVEARMIIGDAMSAHVDQTLIDNLARAHVCRRLLVEGSSFATIEGQTRLSKDRITRLLPMTAMAPDIQRDILQGRQPIGLTSQWLMRNTLPTDWAMQRRLVANL